MDSPLESREVRLRGLPQRNRARVHRGGARAVEGSRSSRGFPQSSRRLQSLGSLPALLLGLILSLFAIDASAQVAAPRAADFVAVVGMRVEPDTVTVGDRFRAAVFVRAPAGSTVALAVPSAADGAYQAVGEARSYPADSAGVHRAVATLVLWITDPAASARAEARVTLPSGAARTIPIHLPLPAVRSVLPADSAQPRPPKDIVPTPRHDWTWAWIAAAVLAALALLALWLWLWRRRRPPPAASPADPREHALAELDRLRASGLPEADVEAFAAGTSAVLRDFAAVADPRLGADLTTSELLDRLLDTGARGEDVDALERALTQADLAKFARRPPSAARALQDWEAARRWVDGFQRPPSAAPALAEAGG